MPLTGFTVQDASHEAKVSALKQMMQTSGWQVFMHELAQRRERVIEEGKKSRANEKQVKIWAKLEGFDEAATLPEKLIRTSDFIQQTVPLEEE